MEPSDLVAFHLRIDTSIKTILKDGKIDEFEIPQLVLLMSEFVSRPSSPKLTAEMLTARMNEMYSYIMTHYNLYPVDQYEKDRYQKLFDTAVELLVHNPRLMKNANSCMSCFHSK